MEPRDPTSSTALTFRRKPCCGSRQVTSFASKPPAVAAGEKEKRDDLGACVAAGPVGRAGLRSLRRRRCGGDRSRPRLHYQDAATHCARDLARRAAPARWVAGCTRVLEATAGQLG